MRNHDDIKRVLLSRKERIAHLPAGKRTPVDGLDAYKVASKILKLKNKTEVRNKWLW